MAYELTGKVKLIQAVQEFASGFSKQEMVVTVEEGNYPQDINLEFLKDKISLLSGLSAGDEVKVSFDIRGREYNGRYYNNLVGWKIERASAQADDPYDGYQPPEPPDHTEVPANYDDDIPF